MSMTVLFNRRDLALEHLAVESNPRDHRRKSVKRGRSGKEHLGRVRAAGVRAHSARLPNVRSPTNRSTPRAGTPACGAVHAHEHVVIVKCHVGVDVELRITSPDCAHNATDASVVRTRFQTGRARA